MIGVILFAHGSRDPLWRGPIESVATQVRALSPATPVACAYLELCTPSLAEAVQQLVTQGATHVTVVPMFLGTGRHARTDLPELVQALQQNHPGVVFLVQSPVGEDPRMTALMAHIATETSL